MATPAQIHLKDTRANQPAASVGNDGVVFCVSDEGDILEISNGTTWESYSPPSVDESNVNITGGTITGITDLAIADGGTGASTKTVAFDNLSPTTTAGDLIYNNGTDNVRLGIGTAGQTLRVNAGATAPEWATGGTGVSGPVSSTDGAAALWDGTGGNTLKNSPLAVGASDLTIGGNGVYRAGGTDVPVADGGTGVSSLTAYAPIFGGTTSTGAVQSGTVGTSGQVLTSNGAGALPTFQNFASVGDSTTTAAYASRPAASNDGNLFLPSDGFQIERDTGSVWAPWGPIFPLTAPVDGDFSWVNQGGASVSTTKGGIFLLGPAGTGVNLRCRVKSAPATPYTITAAFLPRVPGVDFAGAGLLFRQSSDGKMASIGIGHSANVSIDVNKWTNATTFSAQYASLTTKTFYSPTFLRITDNGTNRICSWSNDGQNFLQIHSVGRTDFLTADQVGFFVNAQQATWDVAMTLLSWKET
jgi:hypothetical protein